MKGYLARKRMVHDVRQEYLGVCASLEPEFDPGCVHWPKKDVLCSPVWTNAAAKSVLTQKQNNTSLLTPPTLQHQLHTTEDTHACSSAYPNHLAHSTEGAVSADHGRTSPVLSTTEHEELRDGSVPSPPGTEDVEGSEAAPVFPLPVVGGNVEPEMRSPLGGLQTSTLGSVSDLSVSSSQLSLSAEEGDGEVEHDGSTNRPENANEFKRAEKEGSGEVPDQSTSISERYQLQSVTLESTPPETTPVNEGPTVEVEEDEVRKEVRESVGSNFAVPDAPEELFFREISAIIASAEQEGRSYEELKGQLELELAWVKQAIHSRQQASLLCCVGGGDELWRVGMSCGGWGCAVCVVCVVCVSVCVCAYATNPMVSSTMHVRRELPLYMCTMCSVQSNTEC